LVDSTFLFKVESNINNDTRFETSYRVRKLTNDKALIEKFKLSTTNVSVCNKIHYYLIFLNITTTTCNPSLIVTDYICWFVLQVNAPDDGSSVANSDVDKGKNAEVDVAQVTSWRLVVL
jgi:hypothetical protein